MPPALLMPSMNSLLSHSTKQQTMQNCRLGKDCCPHQSCAETKLLLVHVKQCPAGPNFHCPSKCKGCNETRKLLAHYRRCKEMRTKQIGSGVPRKNQQEQSCLVCSLMARYAKNVMDKSKQKNNVASLLAANLSSSTDAKFNVKKCQFLERTPSMTLMPPPPPRRLNNSSSTNMEHQANASFGSPPTTSQLMHSRIAAVASVTDPRQESNGCDPSLLGKSVDSSCQVPFPTLRRRDPRPASRALDEGLIIPGTSSMRISTSSVLRRPRSESYDERESRNSVKFAPSMTTSMKYYSDEMVEEEPQYVVPTSPSRPRSASCGNVGNSVALASTGCETIDEEGVEHDDVVFPMD